MAQHRGKWVNCQQCRCGFRRDRKSQRFCSEACKALYLGKDQRALFWQSVLGCVIFICGVWL